ncbi:MAG: hypothetical protein WCW31_04275 [Patescibacteria group bacterium]|jgi:hypothetical protein
MSEERSTKFQWISIVYLLLFVLAVFSPSIINQDYLGIKEQHIEEFLIFVFGIAGLSIFMLYERLMEKTEKENLKIQDACERVKKELVSSYQYIGSMNRQMDVLKKLSNDTSVSMFDQAKLSKDLMRSLVSAASGSLGGAPGLIRFVNLDKLRTEAEFLHLNGAAGQISSISIANKELKRVHDSNSQFGTLAVGDKTWLIIPSDRRAGAVKAFMILHHTPAKFEEFDPSVLKVFANQAELVYRALKKENGDIDGTALELIDAATKDVKGEIN